MRFDRALFGTNATPRGSAAAPSAPQGVAETGFVSQLHLPIACDVLDGPPCEQMRLAADQSNFGILALLLHDIDIGAAPRVADEQLDEALKPIRTKLDIVIAMLARLSYRGIELPARCRIELGDRHIAWTADRRLRLGAWLRIAIYFDATFREPVVVFAQATGATALGAGGEYRNEAELAEIPEPIISDLSRLALLVQRRQRGRRDPDTIPRGK